MIQDRGDPPQPGGPSTEGPADFRVDFWCSFLEACGAIFLILAAMEARFEICGFAVV